jgi:hypothetical protein
LRKQVHTGHVTGARRASETLTRTHGHVTGERRDLETRSLTRPCDRRTTRLGLSLARTAM